MSAVEAAVVVAGVALALGFAAWRALGRRIDEASHRGGRSW